MNIGVIIGLSGIILTVIASLCGIAASFIDIDRYNDEIEKSGKEPIFGRKSSKKKKTEDNSQKEE